MKSNAGYYLGSIEFAGGEAQPYDRDSGYYPTEKWLQHDFPDSISEEEAFKTAFRRRLMTDM